MNMSQQKLNFERCDLHFVYRNIQHYNIKRVNKLNHAMRIANDVCRQTIDNKRKAIREWYLAIKEALKA